MSIELADILFLMIGFILGWVANHHAHAAENDDLSDFDGTWMFSGNAEMLLTETTAALAIHFKNPVFYDQEYESFWIKQYRCGFSIPEEKAFQWYSSKLAGRDVALICTFQEDTDSSQATPIQRCTFCGVHQGNPCGGKSAFE